MVNFLSDDWLSQAATALSSHSVEVPEGEQLAVGYEVSSTPFGKRRYTISVSNDGASFEAGTVANADTTFSMDYPTATAISKGEVAAQAAFMRGDLKIDGNINVFVRQHQLFAQIESALTALREITVFEGES